MLGTNRYMRHKWVWRQQLHSAIGIVITSFSISGVLIALAHHNFRIDKDDYVVHQYMGVVTFSFILLLSINGMLS